MGPGFSFFKLRNLLNPQEEEEEDIVQPDRSRLLDLFNQNDELEEEDEMELPDIKTPRTDEYLEFLKSKPLREDFAPSFGRKLGAGALGALVAAGTDPMTGINASRSILDKPYNTELEKFNTKREAFEEGSKAEQKLIPESRRMLGDYMRKQGQKQKQLLEIGKALDRHNENVRKIMRMENRDKAKSAYDTERNRLYDEVVNIRKQLATASMIRSKAYERSVNKQGSSSKSTKDPYVSVYEQNKIDETAAKEVAKDPRFAEWFDPSTNEFVSAKKKTGGLLSKSGTRFLSGDEQPEENDIYMDEELMNEIKEQLEAKKSEIALRRKSSYKVGRD